MSAKPYKFTARRREAFLALLRDGARRGAAADQVGVTRQTVRMAYQADPDFRAAVDQAEMDANEPVEDALYQAAIAGNVRAIEVWLYNRTGERWKDQRNVSGSLSLKVIDVRIEAQKLAKQYGLTMEQVLQEAGLLDVVDGTPLLPPPGETTP